MLESTDGKSTEEFTFWKANQAVTLELRSTVKIKDEPERERRSTVDISYRLITVRERCEDVLSLFWYGLCIYLAALCESSSFPLQPNNYVSHRCVGEQVSYVTVSYSTFSC